MYKSKKPYFYGTGRRKSSVARVHLFENGTGAITINGRDIDDYFGLETLKLIVRQPLVTTNQVGKVDVVATVTGGGLGDFQLGARQNAGSDAGGPHGGDFRAVSFLNIRHFYCSSLYG